MYLKVLKGLPDYYVSPCGSIWSQRPRNSGRKPVGWLKVNSLSKYPRVGLVNKQGIKKSFNVHRLVAAAYCDKGVGCDIVNHIDSNKHNNHYLNLEWVTQQENVRHSMEQGTFAQMGVNCSLTKLTEETVREIRSLHKLGRLTQKEIAAKLDVGYTNVNNIVNFKSWRHLI